MASTAQDTVRQNSVSYSSESSLSNSPPGIFSCTNTWSRSPDGTETPDSLSLEDAVDPKTKINLDTMDTLLAPTLGAYSLAAEATGIAQPPQTSVKRICFVGAGFVGGPTAAVMAYHNPDLMVDVVDLSSGRIGAWNSPHLPMHEDCLSKIVRIARDGARETKIQLPDVPGGGVCDISVPARTPNLLFSTNVTQSVAMADIVFICVNTPTKTYGEGAGAAADLGTFEAATVTIAAHVKPGAIIVEKSTVPCGTAAMVSSILQHYRPDEHFEVLNNPEFLAEGTAVSDLMHPDRVLIGSDRTPTGLHAASVLASVYATWVPRERIINALTFSSELTKLVANAMLAQRISSINAVSMLCEKVGADVNDVASALGADSRLGPKFLQAGVGFGGSCFEKDIRNLAYIARTLHLDQVADYYLSVLAINSHQHKQFARAVVKRLNGNLRGKKVAIFGFAFKNGTSDTRNSVAVHVISQLAEELPQEIAVFDPGCDVTEVEEEIDRNILGTNERKRIRVVSSWREAVSGATAVCILTPWGLFKTPSKKKEAPVPVNARKILRREMTRRPSSSFVEQKLSEMDILELEQLVRQQSRRGSSDQDPLGRLVAEQGCVKNCMHCKASRMVTTSDSVDWTVVMREMGKRSWVFDGRNVVDGAFLKNLGFKVYSIGKGDW